MLLRGKILGFEPLQSIFFKCFRLRFSILISCNSFFFFFGLFSVLYPVVGGVSFRLRLFSAFVLFADVIAAVVSRVAFIVGGVLSLESDILMNHICILADRPTHC